MAQNVDSPRSWLEAYLSMVAAAGEDVAGAVMRRGSADPFEVRDPGYIERTLPALRLMSRAYFRADPKIMRQHIEWAKQAGPKTMEAVAQVRKTLGR